MHTVKSNSQMERGNFVYYLRKVKWRCCTSGFSETFSKVFEDGSDIDRNFRNPWQVKSHTHTFKHLHCPDKTNPIKNILCNWEAWIGRTKKIAERKIKLGYNLAFGCFLVEKAWAKLTQSFWWLTFSASAKEFVFLMRGFEITCKKEIFVVVIFVIEGGTVYLYQGYLLPFLEIKHRSSIACLSQHKDWKQRSLQGINLLNVQLIIFL